MKCYECKYRGEIPGSCHSKCEHPKSGLRASGALGDLVSIMGKRAGLAIDGAGMSELGIELNPHGVRNGWANWPYNFDPVWVTKCDGFEGQDGGQKAE